MDSRIVYNAMCGHEGLNIRLTIGSFEVCSGLSDDKDKYDRVIGCLQELKGRRLDVRPADILMSAAES